MSSNKKKGMNFIEAMGVKEFKRYELKLLKDNIRVCPTCGQQLKVDEELLTYFQMQVILSNDLAFAEELKIRIATGLCDSDCIGRYLK